MYRSRSLSRFVFVVLFVLALAFTALCLQPSIQASTLPAPEDLVRAAWQRAQAVGVYDFDTTLVQTTYPAPSLLNVGRSSRQQTLYLSGQTNQPEQMMHVRLWVDGGNVLNPQQGVEVRVEGQQAYGRTIGQATWDEIDNVTDMFAPSGDPLAYLSGAKNVQRKSESASQRIGESCFTFDVDGPGFAAYVRDQMERHMRETGELPAGLNLETSEQYRGVTGAGEIWLDADGLPLRLTVHMVYPEQRNGERVEAEITTDFTNFARERLAVAPASEPLAWAAARLDLPRTAQGWRGLGMDAGMLSLSLCMVGCLLTLRRSKRFYAIVVTAVIASMLVTPVLQGHHVSAFYERQAARQTEQEEAQKAYEAERDLQEELTTSAWNPHADPMANERISDWQPEVAASQRFSGSASERVSGSAIQPLSASVLQTSAPDSDADGDGLTYAQEIALGTDPNNADTDGDGLTDDVEVKGFYYNGRMWYSNPLEADTNNDGVMDGIECPQRVRETSTARSPDAVCQDTDRDSTPDIFDRDDDGDGVPDRVDISSTTVMGTQTPFSRENPFKLIVNNVQQDKPLVVEFQLRPTDANHLAYAMNVLDWPSGDHAGQVQRHRDNDGTFASTMTTEQIAADPASGNGDVRLLPMLEVEMSGDPIPLPLTTPRTSVEIAGDANGSLDLAQQGANIDLNFDLDGSASYTATIYGHTCAELDLLQRPPLIASQPNPAPRKAHTLTGVADGAARTIAGARLTELADSKHAIVLENDSGGAATCADLGNVVNGPYPDRMIDPAPLRAYGISVRERDDKGTLLAYIPLSLIPDETGGSNVAFGARMIYQQNAGAWGAAHQVRVVWLVQALTDFCKPMPESYQPAGVAPEARQSTWCADINNWDLNQPQVIQTYDETWHLTGLSVREDHGMDVGILFEDPDNDDNVDLDDRLWRVARGLERSFLSGRAADPVTIASIQQRFDNQSNAGASEEARWGVPQNALRVYTYAFPNQDYLPAIPMTHTKQILNDHFVDVLGNARAAAPTLMFAREERSRNAELGDPANTQAGSLLSVNMGTDVQTLVTASWAPYRYQNGAWESYPIAEYLDLLGLRLQDLLRADPEFYDPAADAPEVLQIEAMLGQSYYLAYARGPAQVIRSGGTHMADTSAQLSDADIFKVASRSKGAAAGTKGLIAEAGEGIFKALEARAAVRAAGTATTSFRDQIKSIGRILSGKQSIKLSSLFTISRLKATGKFAGMALLGTAICATAIGISYALGLGGSNTFTSVIGRAFTLLNATYQVYNIVKTMIEVYRAVKQLASGARGLMGLVKTASAKAGVIGLVISVVAALGFFVYAMISNNVQAFSVEFNSALAGVIAGLVVNILMFIIGLIPVYGWIIVAVIGLIDAAISTICLAITTATGKEFDPALDLPNFRLSFCGGINGLATEVIKWLFYSNNLMVQLDNPDRLTFMDIQKSLVKPEDGFITGNALTIKPKFKNRIALNLPHWSDWKAWQYFWQYSEHNLRLSTFDYQLQTTPKDIHEKLWMGQMHGQWQYDGGYVNALAPGYLATLPNVSENIPLGTPGFNRPMDLYMAEGYVVPMQECWSPLSLYWVPVAVCYVRPHGGTSHINLGRGMAFDVFPRTLDEFYTLTAKDSGYSLAWAQSGELAFPRLKDADGDGLINKADGGSDPDDSKWDTDGDGLSDFFESQRGMNLQAADTDGDGVSDYDEIIWGTNPLLADSDGDGLTDKEELDGWAFVYGVDDGQPLYTWVTSDPNVRDTDGDGLSDLMEKTLGFNPRVATDPNILDLETTVNERRAPRLLLRFEGAAGATTFADSSGRHTASCTPLSSPLPGGTGGGCPLAGMDGRYGKGLAFDGVDDAVQVGDTPELRANQYSLSLWFQWDDVGTNKIQFLTGKGLEHVEIHTGGGAGQNNLRFIPAGPNTIFDVPNIIQASWNHIVLVYAGSMAYVYHNGALVKSQPISGGVDLTTDTSPLVIGRRGNGDYPFHGTIDEVLLFDQPLSAAEVGALFAAAYNPDDLQTRPGDSLHYHATAENALTFQYARGLLDVALPDAFSGNLPAQRFDLRPGERATLDGDVQVSTAAVSGLYTMTQISGASITDPRESSNLAELLLRFDEPAGATSFRDDSSLFSRTSATCTPLSSPLVGGTGGGCPTAGAEGVLDRALVFDGVDDVVQVAKTPALQLGSTTIAAWFQADPDVTDHQVILSDQDNNDRYSYALFVSPNDLYDLGFTFTTDDGRYYSIYSASPWSSEGAVRDGKWHHAAVVRNDETKTVQLYVDGTLRKTMTYSGVIDQNNTPIWIGRSPVLGGISPLKGMIDELHIYRRPLSEREVQQLAASPTAKLNFETQLPGASSGESYWPDESGAGHHVSCSAGGVIACPAVGGGGVAGGRGLAITGEHQQVRTEASADLVMGNRFTLSAWVYPRDLRDARQGIIGADVSSLMGYSAPFPRLEVQNRDVWFGFTDTSSTWREASFPNVLTIGTWNHLALSFDSGSATLYVDGQPAATRDFAGDVPRSATFSGFAIGCLAPPGISSMFDYIPNRCLLNGRIDQVAIYKQALAARDVLGLYESSIVALHLPFDDAPGSTRFYNTASSNNGLCSGTSCPESWHNSLMNQAAYFDGVDDVVQIADAPGLRLNRYTLSLWFKWDDFDSDQVQFLTGKGLEHVEIHTGGGAGVNGLRFIPAGGSTILDAPNIIQPGWNHIVFVYVGGSHAGVYRNGELFQFYPSLPPGDDLTTDAAPFVIGRRGDGGYPFHGAIDEVSLYSTDLSAADVAALYNTAPRFRMYLDEASGATQFVDAAGGRTGACTGSACPTAGVKGQIGLAANFDGVDDAITVPLVATDPDSISLSFWAKWAGGSPLSGYQGIFYNGQDPAHSPYAGFFLSINESDKLILGCDIGEWLWIDTQLPVDVWQHIAIVMENNTARFYLNGIEQAVQSLWGDNTCTLKPSDPAHGASTVIGRSTRHATAFNGRLDEVNLYERALSPTEIHAQYLHQVTWVEDRQEIGVAVDSQPPTSVLLSDQAYRANVDTVLHVAAADAGTGIARVELGVNGAWYNAPACRDAAVSEDGASAWCPTFDPTHLSGEGRYTLQSRAIDQVGHVETPTRTVTFYVDGSAPQFSTAIPQGAVLAPAPHPSVADAWMVTLAGNVNDPALSSGDPGSGVAEVEVLLSDPAGAPVGAGTQVAAVNGTAWSVDYVFLDAEPTGHYTLTVTAVDQVGNASTRDLVSVYVDATAPGALLDTISLPPHTLSDDRPPDAVPGLVFHLPFDEAAGATTFVDSAPYEDGVGGNHASCTACPTAGADGQYGGALQFDGSEYVTVPDASALRTPQFTLSAWFQWDEVGTSEVQFLTSKGSEAFEIQTGGGAGTNGIRVIPAGYPETHVDVPDFIQTGWNHIAVVYTGSEVRVYRNGTLVGSKGGLSGADLTANSDPLTIGRRGDGTYPFDGRIDDVRLYDRALPADQVAFISRQRPFDGAVLRLALNEAVGATAFANSAPGAGNDGSCTGATCPTAGVDGQYAAAAQFDGADDYITVPDAPALRTPQFTLSAWFQWDDVDTDNVQFLTSKGNEAFEIQVGGSDVGVNGLRFIPAGYTATGVDAPDVIRPGWNHVAAVYTGSSAYIYHNGRLAASRTGITGGADLSANTDPFTIGRRGDGTLHFDGQIDEVRLFDRVLSAAEIARLSEQLHGLVSEQPALPGALLYLALEEPFGAAAFDDSSANGRRGTCTPLPGGTGGECPTTGVSGQYGSAVQFDGVDDAIILPDVGGPDADAGEPDALALSMWVNVAALPTAGGMASLIHHDGWNADGYVHTGLHDDGRLFFAVSGNAPITQTSRFAFGAQDLNRWVHIAAIYDSAAKRFALYVDGQLDVEGAYTTAHAPILGPGQLGNWDGGARGLNGRVDEVRVYGRPLSADEVARLAQTTSGGVSQVEIAFVPTLPGSPFFNETLAGQVVYLPLDDQANASGSANVFRNVADTGKNGTCTPLSSPLAGGTGGGCPTTGAPGRVGSAATFDGVDDAIIVEQAIPAQHTLAAWVKFDGSKWNYHTIMEFDNDAPWFGVNWQGELQLYSTIKGGAMPIGQWTHVAYTWDGSHSRLYINGAQVVENTSAPSAYGAELGIGHHNGDTPWQGGIDEVRVLDRALTADEVYGLYLGAGPRLHFSFDDADARSGATGYRVTDDSGWEHHGTLSTGAQDAALKSTPGHVGNGALTLDGSGDAITVTNPGLGQTFTIGGWASVRSSAQWRHVIEYGALEHGANAAFRLAVGNPGELSLAIGDGASAAETTLNTGWQYGQWVHWAVTYDGATARVYQNGSEVGALAANKTIAGGTGTFILGSYQGRDRYLDGQIDDVFVYPRVLPPLEIDALYRRAWQTATLAEGGAGAALTSWSGTTPEGLEGAYRVDLRGRDRLGNVDRSTSSAGVWHGSVDTLAPRVITITRAYQGQRSTAKTSCTLTARDFNLSEQRVSFDPACDVQITDRQFYRSPWYVATAGPGAEDKLYTLTAACDLAGHQTGDIRATVCDAAGNCAVASAPVSTPPAITLDTAILTPTHNTALSTTAPIAIAGGAYALDGLRALTVTVNGAPIHTPSYGGGITNTTWSATWTPPAVDGPYLIQATVSDQNGALYAAPPITVVVALPGPSISVASTVLTTTHYDSSGVLKLTGLFTVTGGDARYVQGRIKQTGDWIYGELNGNTWTAPWAIGTQNQPDGATYTVTMEVADATWRMAHATKPILVDVAPPAPVTITVHSGGSSVTPETTLRELSPTLTITWTASSDGSGVAGYRLHWIVSRGGEHVTTTVSTHAPANRQLSRVAGEAQAITLKLLTWDVYGNQTWQTFGTIYVDAPATPAYVAPQPATSQSSSYQGWTESGCTKLGMDARIRDKAQGGASLSAAQELYVSWDTEAINMTWVGADWDVDGDLFIYLDTKSGGSARAYDPYSYGYNETKITFPMRKGAVQLRALQKDMGPRAALYATATTTQSMQADYMVWMMYNEYAVLMTWNADSQQWEEVSGDWTYHLNWNADPYHTEIQIPFATLNITNPTSTALSMVAFASDDYELRLWATMPARNPVNSMRLIDRVPPSQMNNFALTHRYDWPSLGSGVCPSGQDVSLFVQRISQVTGYDASNLPAVRTALAEVQYTGADIELGLEADPTGIDYSVLSDDYFFLMDDLDVFEDWAEWDILDDEYCAEFPDDPECGRDTGGKSDPQVRALNAESDMDTNASQELNAVLDVDHPAVGDGQVITYTLHYANHGEGAATGLVADVMTWGPITLPDGDYYEDEFGEYFNLVLDLGNLAPDVEKTAVFTGIIDLTFDVDNNEGWATLDIIFYDDTGDIYEDQLDWFYIDHEIDQSPPEVQIDERPALFAPGENTVHGIGFDRSPIPFITLEVEDDWGITTTVECEDETPDDGEWDCTFDIGAAEEGDWYYLNAAGTDVFEQEGDWSAWQTFVVDATPPTVTLGFGTAVALGDGVVGPNETVFGGNLADNYLVDAVEVCDDEDDYAGVCEYTDFTLDATTIPTAVYTYDDAPAAPPPINASTGCEFGDPIVRTFTVTHDFIVGEVAVGLNITHEFRYDLNVMLIAPSGEWAEIVWDGSDADNYDVLLYDSAPVANADDWDDHDPSAPYYENERRPDDALAIFYGEQAQGVWQLEICDYFPDEDHGDYNHSRLILTADVLPENTRAAWSYTLPDVDGLDSVTRTLEVYGWDGVGNVSDPLALTFRVDTVAPVVTVTQVATEIVRAYTVTVLSGEVTDGGAVEGVFMSGYTPSGEYFVAPGVADGDGWRCDLQPGDAGVYTLWVEAVDEAGNGRIVGPFTVTVLAPPLLEKRTSAIYDVMLGSTVTYTLVLNNDNDVPMHGVVITDRLPTEVHFITQTAGTLLLPPVDDVLAWGPYSVAAGGVFSLTFSAVVTDNPAYYGAVVTNTAHVTSTEFGGSSAQATFTIQREPLPVLSIVKSVATAHTPALLGDAITYTVLVSNSGNGDALGVTVTDDLPDGVTGDGLSWTGVITAGGQVAFTIPAVVTSSEDYYGHTIINTARYSSTNAGNGAAEATFAIVSAPTPLLSIVKSVATAHTPPQLGDAITYTIVVSNSGNGDALGVTITDDLPDGVTGDGLSWTGVITAGGQAAFTIPAVVTSSEDYYGHTIINTARYSSTNAGNGSVQATFTVETQGMTHIYLPLVLRKR